MSVNLDKYDNLPPEEQKPFDDPVLRCDSCQEVVKRKTLHKLGCCDKCGNKRVRPVTVFSEEERAKLVEWGFGDFVSKFKEVSDE